MRYLLLALAACSSSAGTLGRDAGDGHDAGGSPLVDAGGGYARDAGGDSGEDSSVPDASVDAGREPGVCYEDGYMDCDEGARPPRWDCLDNPEHCGACGNNCFARLYDSCSGGECACGGEPTDLARDPDNCGACGESCRHPWLNDVCAAGRCGCGNNCTVRPDGLEECAVFPPCPDGAVCCPVEEDSWECRAGEAC